MSASTTREGWGRSIIVVFIICTAVILVPGLGSIYASSQPLTPLTQAEIEAKVTDGSYQALYARAAQKPVRLIITLNLPNYLPEGIESGQQAQGQRINIKQVQAQVLDVLAGKKYQLLAAYDVFPLLAIEGDQDVLQTLAALRHVLHIKEDTPERPTDLSSNHVIGVPQTYSLGYDGTGQVIAILDSGVQTGHPFLKGRILNEACFSTTDSSYGSTTVCPNGHSTSGNTPGMTGAGAGHNCSTSITGCTHGTHVAGIALGHNYTGGPGYDGVAKGAKYISIQVFSRFDSPDYCSPDPTPCVLAFNTDTIAALEYVYTTLSPIRPIAAVNMSLGGGKYTSYCDTDPRKPAIDNLRSRNIATVIAAGNAGYTNALGAPACISSAISVGATEDSNAIAVFSNRAGFLRLFAPGVSIDSSIPTNSYANYAGTSMAAPHVTGAWAVMKSKKPNATVNEILLAFKTTGIPIPVGNSSVPRIRLDAAIKNITAPTLTPTRTPTSAPTNTPAPIPTNTPSGP